MLKRLVSLMLVVVMLCSMGTYALAAENLNRTDDGPSAVKYEKVLSSNITSEERTEAEKNGLIILEKITDPVIIKRMVDSGEAEVGRNGELPEKIMTYFAPDDTNEVSPSLEEARASSGITISKTKYYDGRYFDDYERYVIDGPAEYTKTYSRTDYCDWNTSISGSVSVGGKVYKVADVKAAVEGSVGYKMGRSKTSTDSYKVKIPANKYWEIKVWTSFLVYEYTAKVGNTKIATGRTWKPNGLVIRHTEYKS